VLNVVRHDLELVCESDKIPDQIEIDVTGREVGDSIHISEITLPAGSESAITDRDFTIATLVAPSALKKSESEEEEGEEVAADEVEATAQSGGDDADNGGIARRRVGVASDGVACRRRGRACVFAGAVWLGSMCFFAAVAWQYPAGRLPIAHDAPAWPHFARHCDGEITATEMASKPAP
jgi:hypothetical protein